MDTKAAFEKWCSEKGYSTEQFHYGNWAGKYKLESVRNKWEGWQASRAAIEIELPEANAHLIWVQAGYAPDDYWDDVEVSRSKEDKCCDGSDRYEVYAKWQLEEVLTSHGIRIKGRTE